MKTKLKEKEILTAKAATTAPECSHYWVIEVADGPTSQGECKYCGATKEFFNAFPEINPLRRSAHLMRLPEMPGVGVEEEEIRS